jgi:hypothetical protein
MKFKNIAALLLAITGFTANASLINVNDSLLGYWAFDENQGTSLSDSSGAGNVGTVNGANWTSGIAGSALIFDGINDKATIGGFSLQGLSTFSVSAWVNVATSFGNGCCGTIVGERSSNKWALRLDNRDNKPLELIVNPWGGDGGNEGGNIPFRDNWFHIVGVFDGGKTSLFVDGALVNTSNSSASVPSNGGTLALEIGGASDGWFKGGIDEVRIYETALTQQDVLLVKNSVAVSAPSSIALLSLTLLGLGIRRRVTK